MCRARDANSSRASACLFIKFGPIVVAIRSISKAHIQGQQKTRVTNLGEKPLESLNEIVDWLSHGQKDDKLSVSKLCPFVDGWCSLYETQGEEALLCNRMEGFPKN